MHSTNTVRTCGASGALLALCMLANSAQGALSIQPISWNIVGLDSNNVNAGPNRFPVGARVCSDVSTGANNVTADFSFTTANPLINLRAGSLDPITLGSFTAGQCKDAYFEVEVTRTAAAYTTTRGYVITATEDALPGNTVSTPTPREFYVERLISQNRNSITSVAFGPVGGPLTVVGPGGPLNLVIGNTYDIMLTGGTATQGYEQFAAFAGLTNSVFRIIAVATTLSADTSTNVVSPNDLLYADACRWENDPNSPNYLGCNGTGKAGGNFTTTYTVQIISAAASSETMFSLIYDFSGSSFHYNADYDSGGRTINIIDEQSAGFTKNFSPTIIGQNGVSTLRFTISNPNAVSISGYNFVDNLPAGVVVANPPNVNTAGCGSPTFAPAAGATSLSFSNGTVAANNACVVSVQVTGANAGTYNNISNNLFVGTANTGINATATLTISSVTPPPPGSCAVGTSFIALARWEMNPAQGTSLPPAASVINPLVSSATASFTGPSNAINTTNNEGNPANSWEGNGWPNLNNGLNANFSSYWQFTVDSSQFYGLRIGLNAAYTPNGAWTAGNNQGIVIYSQADGAPFINGQAPIFAVQNFSKNGFNTVAPTDALATATGTSTTTFRVMASGVGTSLNPAAFAILDNIVIEGCPPPTGIAKVFNPATIAVGQTSVLTFTLRNPSLAVTQVTFTDNLPAGLQVANPTGVSTSGCGTPTFAPAAGATSLSFSNGSIAAGATCTVNVTVLATGPSAPGVKLNVSGNISTLQTGTNFGPTGSATAELVVLSPPVIGKRFLPGTIAQGAVSTLRLDLSNPNVDNPLSGVAFADNFPAGLVVANPPSLTNSCGGVFTPAPIAGANSLNFSGGTIAAGGSCAITVRVTAAAAGSYVNTTGVVSAVINGATVNGNTANATLVVDPLVPGISLGKQVGLSASGPWVNQLAVVVPAPVFYRFTIENTGTAPLTGVTLTDPTVSTASCPLIPNPLPAPSPINDNHIYVCVVGPIASVAGTVVNTATTQGSFGAINVSDVDSAIYRNINLMFDKSASPPVYVDVGDVITYSFTVTNTGAASLQGPVVVIDDRTSNESCPALTTIGDLDNFLDPGESLICSATFTITAANLPPNTPQVVNIAYATVGGVDTPTDTATVLHQSVPVTLSDVHSTLIGSELQVRFGTLAEAGTLGYSVAMELSSGTSRVALQTELTMAQGSGVEPRSYQIRGRHTAGSTRFWIIEHTVEGAQIEYGPYLIGQSFGEPVALQPIDWHSIAVQQQDFRRSQADIARGLGHSGGVEAEVRVAQSGWVSISHDELLAAGLDLRGVALGDIALSRGGNSVPVRWSGSDPFAADTTLTFHGEALSASLYTQSAVYRLRSSPGAGRNISVLHAPPGNLPTVESSPQVFRHAPNRGYSFSSTVGDPWFALRIVRNNQPQVSATETFNLPAKIDSRETLRLVLWGGLDHPSVSPDHHGVVYLNGQPLGSFSFDGVNTHVFQTQLPSGVLRGGANTLQIDLLDNTGLAVDVVYLESLEVHYQRELRAQDNRLDFEPLVHATPAAESLFRDRFEAEPTLGCAPAACSAYSISGFTSPDIRVMRAQGSEVEELGGVRIEADGSFYRASFAITGRAGDRIWMSTGALGGAPAGIQAAREPTDLVGSDSVDYLVISHPSFISTLEPLLTARQAGGLRTKVVDIEQIYRNYSDGVVDPEALRRYLVQAVPRLGVRYVLLVGGDTYDYFNIAGSNSISFIPTNYRQTSAVVRFAPTDMPYADFNQDGLIDVALGRFPVRTQAELTTLIAKTLAYQSAPHARQALLVSDRNVPGVNFGDILAPLVDLLGANWSSPHLRLQDYPSGSAGTAQARTDMVAQLQGGRALVSFLGHSAPASWTQESLLTAGLLYGGLLQNADRPTVVWQLGCYGTYFVSPNYNTIAHALLLQGNGGAAAVIGASGLTAVSSDQRWMQTLGPRLLNSTFGEALKSAQLQMMQRTNGQFDDITVGGNLLGDPALQLSQ